MMMELMEDEAADIPDDGNESRQPENGAYKIRLLIQLKLKALPRLSLVAQSCRRVLAYSVS